MKYIKKIELVKESVMTSLPEKRYPITYKCTHIYDIADTLEKKYQLDLHNLKPGIPTKNEYHDFNLYDFIGDKIQKENTIFPKMRLKDEPGVNDARMESYTDPGSVILLPAHYDSAQDDIIHKKKTEEGRNKLIDIFKQVYKGDQLKKAIEDIDKHVDFGRGDFEYANIALDKIYDEYKQYFNNGYLRVWMPYDWDSDNFYSENPNENTSHGYPIEKMLHLSDIEKYLETNYNLSDKLFYQFIVYNNYVENRYWEKPLGLHFEEDKFIRKGGKYGMDATRKIDLMLSILEREYKDLFAECEDGYLPIYIDYYKKVKPKY